jgi:hypothetical protein
MERSPDARLAAIARNQAGAFNRSQAYAAQLSPGMLRRRTANATFRQLDDDVWAFAAAPAGWIQDCWAATLIHPRAGLSHLTAASQLCSDIDRERPLHVEVPLTGDHRSRSVVVHRSRHHRIATHDGLRITRFEQVLVQLAATRPDMVRSVLHSGVNDDPRRLDKVLRHLHRLRGSRLPDSEGCASWPSTSRATRRQGACSSARCSICWPRSRGYRTSSARRRRPGPRPRGRWSMR